MTNSTQDPELTQAAATVREQPSDFAAWDALEAHAERTESPEPIVELYVEALSGEHAAQLARKLRERSLRFGEAWFGDDAAPMQMLLAKLFVLDPRDEVVFDRLAVSLTAAGSWDLLLDVYERALSVTDSRERRTQLLDDALKVAKDLASDESRTLTLSRELVSLRPDDAALRAQLERLLERSGRSQELVMSLETHDGGEPAPELRLRIAGLWLRALRSPPTALEQAEGLLGKDGVDEGALALIEEVLAAELSSDSTKRAALALLVEAYGERERWADQARVLRVGAPLYEGTARTERHLAAARLLQKSGEAAEALTQFGEAFVRAPGDAALLAELEAHAEKSALQAPLADLLERAAAVDDGSPEIATRRAQLLLRAARLRERVLREPGRVVALYRRVLDQDEAVESALEAGHALDALHDEAGDAKARIEVLERLGKLEPVQAVRKELAGALAKVALSVDDRERAIRAYKRRLDDDVRDREALDGLVAVYEQQRAYQPLIDALRQRAALSTASDAARDLGRVGQIYADELGDLDQALKALGEVFALAPEQAVELAQQGLIDRAAQREVSEGARRSSALADAYRGWLADPEQALAYYGRALSIAPDLPMARTGLHKLLADEDVRGRAADLLAGSFATTDDVDGLLKLLPDRLASASTGGERARLLRQAAQLEANRREAPDRAFAHARAALIEDPQDSSGDLELWRLAEQQNAWAELAVTLREATDRIEGNAPRRAQLQVSEGELRELRLMELPRALEVYQAASRALPADTRVAEAVCRVAALLGRYAEAFGVVVALADRLDQVPDALLALLEERAADGDAFGELAQAAYEQVEQARVKPPVRRALLLRIAEWHERGAGDSRRALALLLEASKLGGPHAETLRRLATLQRRAPDRALVDTLLAAADLDERELGLLSEAAELARNKLSDEALERTVLERLVRRAAHLLREGRGSNDGGSPEEVLVASTHRLADKLAAAGESKAELALLREAASFPIARASARAFAERAAQLAVGVLGNPQLAIQLYQSALELAPEDPAILAALGAEYARLGRLDDLVVLRRRELAATPSVARRLSLRLDLARVLGQLEARGGRLAALRENLQEAPGHRESLQEAEQILRSQGALPATFELLSEQAAQLEAIGEASRAAELWARAAELADAELGDDERALVAYQRLAGIEHDERALSALARIRQKRGEPRLAVPWLERSLEGRPLKDRPEVRLRLAHAHEEAGDLESAMRTLEAGVQESQASQPLREQLAHLYERLGRIAPLADLLADSASRATDPEQLLAHARRAAALYREPLKTPERGVDVLAKAVAAQPNDRALKLDYVDALIAAEQHDKARGYLESLVNEFGRRRSPERAELHMRLSRVARGEGKLDEALEQLDTAASMDRSHPDILRALGELAVHAGQLERAERAYRTLLIVLRKQPAGADAGAAEVLYELHRIASELGQKEKAAELLEQSVQTAINSENETARLKSLLLSRGEPELLLRVLEQRLAQVASPATEAEVLSDLADVLEKTLERKDEALDARLKALACAPEIDALHAATLRVASALGQEKRYVDTLTQLMERARRRDDHAQAADLALRAGAVCEHGLSDLDSAASFYQQVSEGLPSYIEAQFALARVAGKQGHDDAEHAVLSRLAALPDEPAYEEGKRGAVYRLIELSVRKPDTREEGLAKLAKLLEAQPDYARASKILQSAYESDPSDLATLSLLEQTARQSGSPGVLLEALERRARLDDVPLAVVREAAELAASVNAGERAEALAGRAIALAEARDDQRAVGWAPVLLARTLARRGEVEQALTWFERALTSSEPGESFELGLELASLAAASRGERARAMAVYERLREQNAADRRVWQPLLTYYAEQEEYEKLQSVVDGTLDALDNASQRNALRLEASRLLFEAGQEEPGVRLLEAVLEEDPDHAEAALRLADLYERRGQTDALVELLNRKLERAREQRSPSVIPLSLRMGALLAKTRPEDAADVYRRALALMPDSDALLRAAIEQCDPQEQAEERAALIVRYLSAEDAQRREGARGYVSWLVDYRAEQLEPVAFEQALELAHRVTPESEEARKRLSAWHHDRNNHARVAELLESEARSQGEPERAVLLLVEAADLRAKQLNQPIEAAALLRKARELAPGDLTLLRRAVQASADAGDLLPALADVDATLDDLSPGAEARPELLRLRAQLASQAGLHDQAVTALSEAYELEGDAAFPALRDGLDRAREAARNRHDESRERELTLRLSKLLDEHGESERAIDLLDDWNARVPHDLEVLRTQLQLASRAGQWESALNLAQALSSREDATRLPETIERLVEAARRLGQPQRAREALELAIERAPEDPRLASLLELLYREMGAHAALARLLARGIDELDDDAARFEHLRRVGQLLVEAGESEEAMTYLARALALKPDDFATVIAVADARIGAGHYDQARELLERGIGSLRARRSPELSQLRHRMARLVAAQGDEQGRYDWLNSALEADMNNGDVASELAVVAQHIGHLDTALKALRAITMMKGEAAMSRAEAFYRQAIIVAQKGEPRRAVLWAKKAKAEDQHFPGVDRLIQDLESA